MATFSGVVGPPPLTSWSHYYYEKAIKGIPTCYIFPSPQDSRSPRPPFHSLVPQGSSREPGLILVSAAGSVRFWDSIGIGLAGGENYSSSDLNDMEYDEEVTNLIRADVSLFLSITNNPAYLQTDTNIYSFNILRKPLSLRPHLYWWEVSPGNTKICTAHRIQLLFSTSSVLLFPDNILFLL